jgi:lipopolysaccharide/colanic/teichoic acid biosynthesis glycosyltransferase/glycosyltransferase involved in cell wall biosynthesis
MKILIVSQYYWPEDFAAGVYIPELAERLAAFGHRVSVITGPPNYPTGRIHPGYNRPYRIEERNGVRIIRSWFVPSPRSSGAARRGLTAVSFAWSAVAAGLALRERPDVVLGLSPPVFMGAAAGLLARRWGVPWLLNVKDLFTESVIASGLASPGLLMSGLATLERAVYRSATHIVTNAEGFAEYLRARVPPERVTVVPDWADGDFISPAPHATPLRKAWGLGSRFVVLYSGSIGYSSDLETLLDAASRLPDVPDLAFVIVGDGVKLAAIRQKVASLALKNVSFFPLQPRDRLPEVLATADLTVVTLSASGGRVSTQGKLYSFLAAGRPVLAIVPAGNDARRVIESSGCGWVVDSGDTSGTAAAIREARADAVGLAMRGRMARARFDADFSLDICARRFEQRLLALVSAPASDTNSAIQRLMKRAFDFCASLVALVLVSPILGIIAVAVRVSSPGPVLFRARRAGLAGRPFDMLKFRTMRQGSPDLRNPDGSTFNAAGDPRVTHTGAWLRRTSLDELPQLWNVICGDMSLVGPRPDLPDQLRLYTEADYQRLRVRPGITGLAQVSGRNRLTWQQRRALDLEYVSARSMWLDLSILARTVPGVLFGRGVFGVTDNEPHDESRQN